MAIDRIVAGPVERGWQPDLPPSAYRGRRPVRIGGALPALGLAALLLAMALAAPLVEFWVVASGGPPLQAPSPEHPMGTDDLGRDLLVRLLYGTRTALAIGLLVPAISGVIGSLVGGLGAFVGGWVDDLGMRLTEFFQIIPRFFLAIVVIALFGPGLMHVILVLGFTSWPMVARILRSEVLALREQDYILAARALGLSPLHIAWRHILPNTLPSLLVTLSLLAGNAILLEAGLSFLGLGDPDATSLGYMLNSAQRFLRTAWWMAFFPGSAIVIAVLAFNLLGDTLNE